MRQSHRPPIRHGLLTRSQAAAGGTGAWLTRTQSRAAAAFSRASQRADDRGATAIEWAIFALLSLVIAGLVAAAITAAVNNRLPGIQ